MLESAVALAQHCEQEDIAIDRGRRAKQIEFNAEHDITPQTVRKQVRDIMEGARSYASRRGKRRKAAESASRYRALAPEQALREITNLEKKMYQHARDLEFEDAAHLRDEIQMLREISLGLPDSKVG